MSTRQLDAAIAVTGMACRFPSAPDVSTFWRNLCARVDAIKRFEPAELRRAGVTDDLLYHPSFVPVCAPIPEPYAFDAAHFGIAAATARILDLQHRVFLECAWTALEASGTLASGNRSIAVFAGCSNTSHKSLFEGLDDGQAGMLAASLGSNSDYLASRVAFLLNLQGPAVTVLAACATSLVVVHLAVQSLLTNECDVAVAGGAAIRHPLIRGHLYEPGGIYSSDGLCRPYDHLSSGIVSGDGVGAVVLRRLSDAIADGDHVHAIICGSAITNDGARKGSFTAPSVEGQFEAALTALEVADIDPVTIGFIEGHGTATPLGDPIEVEALRRAWGKGSKGSKPCVLGSVKSGIGHLDAAAGIASFIKACLAVEHGRIPATLNYSAPNPHLELADSPFVVSAETLRWNNSGPRRASVHSLGLGGTNVHVLLEQFTPADSNPSVTLISVPVALTLSTRHPEAMRAYADSLAAELTPDSDAAIAARTLQYGRVAEPYRQAVVGSDSGALIRALLSLKQPVRPAAARPRLVLAFSGDGKRIRGALRQLAEHLPPVAATMREAAAHLQSRWGIDLFETVTGAESSPLGIIPTILAQGVALHAALEQFGAGGDVVLGQSLGELTAAVASGVIDLRDALDLGMAREQAFRDISPSGALAVNLAPSSVLERLPRHLELSLVNSPTRCVISGEVDALAQFAAELEAEDVPVQLLELISAVHCSLLDPVLSDYRRAAARLKARSLTRTFLSSVGPCQVNESVAANPDHWTRQLRETVRFDSCLKSAVADHNDTIVVDVGPAGGLTTAIQETIGNEVRAVVRVPPHTTGMSEIEAFALALGKLWEHGVRIDWDAWPRRATRRTSLPVPPLARTNHETGGVGASPRGERSSLALVRLWARNWRRTRVPLGVADRFMRAIVFAGSDPVGYDVAGILTRLGHDVELVTGATQPDFGDHFDLIVDARALGELNGPAAATAFLEVAARATQQGESLAQLVVLTRGAFDIVGTEMLSASAAGLATTLLVVAQEHTSLNLTCLDLGSETIDTEMLGRVLTSTARPGVLLGLRGRTIWEPVMEPVNCSPRSVTRPITEDACVIIGGLGRFGCWVGRWLAQHGCRELFLVSRTGVMQGRRSDAIAAMRQVGSKVTVIQADVTDRAAIFRILEDVKCSSSGRVTVLHLAGEPNAASACVPINDLVRGDPRPAFEEQWAAKVTGALALLDWTRRHPETRCVVFSSNAAVLGGLGLAAYSAANAAVDAIAISARDRKGLDWCSIGWDGWRLADDEPSTTRSALESFALRGEEPWEALQKAIAAEVGHLVVAKGDLLERHRVWVEEPARADFQPGTDWVPTARVADSGDGNDAVTAVRRIWSEVLGYVPDHDDTDLFELGGDSLTAMRIRTRIEGQLGTRLTLQELLQNRTVTGLAALVRTNQKVQTEANNNEVSQPATGDQTISGRI